MYVGYEAIVLACALASFVLACRALVQACFARRADSVTGRLALLWTAACLGFALVIPSLDGFAGSAWAALISVALFAIIAILGWRLARHWREQAMEREAERFAAARYYALKAEDAGDASTPSVETGGVLPIASQGDCEVLCARAARAFDLTRREEEVLAFLIRGSSASDVAQELVLSPNTVKTHIRNLYRKLGINRREDLARRLSGGEG